jgi:hypothetical protein
MTKAYYQDNRTEKLKITGTHYTDNAAAFTEEEYTESNALPISVVDPDPYVFGSPV